jgi:hypothetical protein
MKKERKKKEREISFELHFAVLTQGEIKQFGLFCSLVDR